ncbi:RNA-binding protein, putative [Entamoeba invadens IP1]|uniref:RNA-binding protein, putative n=2 Tax=Entamoeba invadens TaxID=33085 RepID=A0A0A1UCB6_ENTIV|nr:RNA-binding protein, putative [Entamoeba invadens IP1]BAN40286.1 RNA-binding protein, putative [Entamoeba invadens]ELP91333.1 RNA-binding protein, putative [Entamoeba invadens IP1]BAN40816.1 RNA-binding protein, putative [Entamoeba invadens]BAN41313.1 RNA-binding protein, putative [Entamoeba invadens]BAN42293.1 RNA-binding protein, putative [Entamoeba invadens]|eukprot:XP_004258104.1 RNA-binding protein, putative [Entamoeba invadens IP1]
MSGLLNRYGKRENAKPMTTLFFARLGASMKEQVLKDYCKHYGEVVDVTMVCDRETKKNKGCAFVKFKTSEEAQQCLSSFENLQDNHWIVEWAKSTQIRDSDLDKKTLYITGISNTKATDTDVYDHFSQYGIVEKVTVVGKDADFPPYAFVKFTDEKSANLALKNENGKKWDGEVLIIQFSETLESKKSRRLNRVKPQQTYISLQQQPELPVRVLRRIEPEDDDRENSLFKSLLSAFNFSSESQPTPPPEDDDQMLMRKSISEMKKADSPLLHNYEKIINQLEEDGNTTLKDQIDEVKHPFTFLDDDVWGPFQ